MAKKKLIESEQIYNITTDSQLRHDMYAKIVDFRAQIKSNQDKIVKLKRNAKYVQNCKEKNRKCLQKIRRLYDMIDPVIHPFFSNTRNYMIIFTIRSNSVQLMRNDKKKW